MAATSKPTEAQWRFLKGLAARCNLTVREVMDQYGKRGRSESSLTRGEVSRLIADLNKRLGYRSDSGHRRTADRGARRAGAR